jgi:hypothetical protein
MSVPNKTAKVKNKHRKGYFVYMNDDMFEWIRRKAFHKKIPRSHFIEGLINEARKAKTTKEEAGLS